MLSFRSQPMCRFATGIFSVLILVSPLFAQQSAREVTSLKFVPATTSVYCSMLNNRAKYDAVVKSNAVKQLMDSHYGKMAADYFRVIKESSLDQGDLATKEMQALKNLGLDFISNEMFLFIDDELPRQMELTVDFYKKAYARLMRIEADPETDEEQMFLDLIKSISDEDLEKVKLPNIVFGGKLKQPGRAQLQLAMLYGILDVALKNDPDLAKLNIKIEQQNLAGGAFFTVTLDEKLLPWDEIEKEVERQSDEYKKELSRILPILKKKKIVLALGITGDYLVAMIGNSTKPLENWGKGKLLIDRPEFALLRKHEKKRFTSIGYSSEAVNRLLLGGQIENMAGQFRSMVHAEQKEIGPKWTKKINEGIDELEKDLLPFELKPGAGLSFGFFSPQGIEGYSLDWSGNQPYDATQKLSILDHLGGDPIFFLAGRQKYRPEVWKVVSKWCLRAFTYGDEASADFGSESDQRDYARFKQVALPLFKSLDKTVSKKLVPSLRDGQCAFVLDMKSKSKQWLPLMPPSNAELAIPEIAVVCGVSDSKLFKESLKEFRQAAQDVVDQVRALEPNEIPEGFSIPQPILRKLPQGEAQLYPIPDFAGLGALGLEERLMPTIAITEQCAAVTLSPLHAARLSKPTPLSIEGPLARIDRPLASAAYYNNSALIDEIYSWVLYAFELGLLEQVNDDNDEADDLPRGGGRESDHVREITRKVARLLKCFHGYQSVTYAEGKALVTHRLWHFEDVPVK